MSPKTFDIAYLSDNLTDLLSDIQNHVEVTLTRQGVPWAKVLPLAQPEENSIVPKAGLNRGSMVMSDDFDEPLPDSLLKLSKNDREVFVNALLNPPEPGEKLRDSAKRYKQRMGL